MEPSRRSGSPPGSAPGSGRRCRLGPSPVVIELEGKVVVLSPHLDDAVLSIGAGIRRATRLSRAGVTTVTVMGCDPHSHAPAGFWDRQSGFRTEGEAARRRREEDRRACQLV